MSIKDIFGKFLNKNDTIFDCYCSNVALEIFYKELAINSAINIIAKLISNAEFRTFRNHKEIFEKNYYLFNIEPNQNENATEFWQKIVRKLIYDNEVLVIQENGKYYMADHYSEKDRTLYQTSFENVSVKELNFKKTYYMEDVFYFKLNDGKIRNLIDELYSSYGTLLTQCFNDYKKSKGIRGKVKLASTWSQKHRDQEQLQKVIQNKFRSYFSSDNAVLPLEEGFDFIESERKIVTNSGEVKELIDEIFTIVAIAFNIPKGVLNGDLADVAEQRKNLMTLVLKPFSKLIQNEINRKLYGQKAYSNGSYLKVDINRVESINIFDIAGSLDVLTRIGFSYNQLLRILDEELINEEWANEHYITKNYEQVRGGKKDEKE